MKTSTFVNGVTSFVVILEFLAILLALYLGVQLMLNP